MRLCNAILGADYGADFLPIDDDRPDRGNDGYLKSEKRIFAAHCFKRAQNRALDREIRSKMVGDLGKALALKDQNLWDIEAWTFLSNYPIPEETARAVLQIGNEAAIDVSWEGPDFLALGLQRHPEIRERFPQLAVHAVAEQLHEIKDAVERGSGHGPEAVSVDRVPRTAEERSALLTLKPDGWEYLLFAAALYQGKTDLEMKWHDHEMPPHRAAFPAPSGISPTDYLGKKVGEMAGIVEAAMQVFPPDKQEKAFGKPGEPGDQVRIEHFANRIVESYEKLLDWAKGIHEFEPPGYLVEVCEVLPHMADRPLEGFREFIDGLVAQADRIPDFIADPDPEKGRLVIELDLVLKMDDDVTNEFSRRLKRAEALAVQEAEEA